MKGDTSDTPSGLFEATDWAAINGAKSGDIQAMKAVWDAYSRPAEVLLKLLGIPADDRKDMLQGFFLDFFQRSVAQVNAKKGVKFRSWFRTVLRNFVFEELRKEHKTLKRGANYAHLSLTSLAADGDFDIPAGQPTCDSEFDRAFAVAFFTRVFVKLEGEYRKAQKAGQFLIFWNALLKDEVGKSSSGAESLKTTEGAFRISLHRFRQRFKELVIYETRATGLSAEEAQAECVYLSRLWCEQNCAIEQQEANG